MVPEGGDTLPLEKVARILVQVYEFNDASDGKTYYWNATLGRLNAIAAGHRTVSVDLVEASMTTERILSMYPDLDVRHALDLPLDALLDPLLFVTHKDKHVLIDGWHRLYRASVLGLGILPAYILSHDEADRIRHGGT